MFEFTFFFLFITLIVCVSIIFGLAISALLAYLVYQDAVKHDVPNPELWSVGTFFLGFWVIVFYLLLADRKK